MYITVAETVATFATTGTVLTHGASTVTFTATTTEILIFWHLDSLCNTQGSDNTLTTIQCTSAICSCTAASVPDVAVTPSPNDLAMDVAINTTNPASLSVGPFSWTDNGEATTYDFNIIGVGTASGVGNPVTINYAWAYNTTYQWSITSTNCLGSVTSPVYSFTTEMDPSLSVDEFDSITALSVYPNPANDIVNIKTDLTIDSIDVINMLGQTVKTINGKTITNNAIDISTLGNGVYFLNISAEGKSQSIRIIKE